MDASERLNNVRIIGTITLVAVLALAIVGMDWVTRVQLLLLGLLIVSQFDFIIGSIIGPTESEKKFGFTGYKLETFQASVYSDYHDYKSGEKGDFFKLFGVFFPAVTGIVAGANLSGDLKDPATAIPKGTLLAIATTFVTYIGYGVMVAGMVFKIILIHLIVLIISLDDFNLFDPFGPFDHFDPFDHFEPFDHFDRFYAIYSICSII